MMQPIRPFAFPLRLSLSLGLGLLAVLMAPALVGAQLPEIDDPDGKPADMNKPVQVFIMMGQSTMLGFGQPAPASTKGTLAHYVKNEGKYPYLVDDQGKWTQRKDVRYVFAMHNRGSMQINNNDWLGPVDKGRFGPELGAGYVLGEVIDAPVMMLKVCIGNRSLGWDLLPPGSERFKYDGFEYAGYKESPSKWPIGKQPEDKPHGWYAGKQYDDDVANAKTVLKNLSKYYPGAKGYEVAGFLWWQGHKDQNPAHAWRYEHNLINLIAALRKDFDAPDAPFVAATVAFEGNDLGGHGLTVLAAQMQLNDWNKHPHLKGNAAAFDARPFWRSADESPKNQGYHYNHNGATYMDVGLYLGAVMADLLLNDHASGGNDADDFFE